MRLVLLSLGWLNVALAVIGAILPVMPTTVFLIIAAGCFAKSSPRLERWLLDHPRFGGALRAWREDGSMSGKHKALAVGTMGISVMATVILGRAIPWVVKVALVGVTACVAGFILTRPSRGAKHSTVR